jgi:pimeloyl-ACP methyl ester carboxylesterase
VLGLARRWAAFLVLLALLIPAVIYREWTDAQASAFVVLATTIDTPVLNWIASASTDAPRIEEAAVAGQAATIARPASGAPWPAVVFVNGATDEGHLHPEVQRLARGLARAGFVVTVPELPGLRGGEITLRTLRTLVEIGEQTSRRSDVEDGRVGFVGVSVGASLALVAAEDEALQGRVSAVAGIAPYSDLKEVARLATTGFIRSGGQWRRYDADDFVLLAVARSLVAALPSPSDRSAFLDQLASIPNERNNPLAGFRLHPSTGPGGRALFTLLANDDPYSFDRLWAKLPARLHADAKRLSPISRAERLTMPVELATSPEDDYFPVSESRRLERRAPSARVTVTDTLSHAVPEPSFDSISAVLSFDGWAVRSIRALRG